MTIACNLPYHIYGYIDKQFLSQRKVSGWEKCIWFAINVPTNRAIGLNVLLENGAVFRQLPPHAFAFKTNEVSEWSVQSAQAWDCFGGDAQVIEYAYLRELTVCSFKQGVKGTYLFTLEFDDDGFSRYPAQSKCLHCIALNNGRLTLQPNDHLRWIEGSFTDHNLPTDYLRRQDRTYESEE